MVTGATRTEMKASEWVVVASTRRIEEARERWGDTLWSVVEWPEDVDEAGERLGELYESGRRGFVVFGGDELVGRVVTAYWRRRALGKHPLCVWPLEVGDETRLAGSVGKAAQPQKAVRLASKNGMDWERRKVGTLKVTASTEPAAWYGFSFAAGWAYRAAVARKRARGGAGNLVAAAGRLARETVMEDGEGALALRVAVDYAPREGEQGSMVASTLPDTYFGLGAPGGGATLWEGLATRRLIGQKIAPEALRRFRAGGQGFESVHLDTPEGWVLDGRLHGGDDSGVVQVVPGPTVELTWPKLGLVSRMRGLWG